ncbi:MAG TPA: type II toxin-antitoxin system death-on-curing family toxin [Ktedonobacterales bacterium]|jgi:death-on-curing protein|nr:type II toxin-antitoxin system death-on-curing family toxin [Ktedonobacterales bacterium]
MTQYLTADEVKRLNASILGTALVRDEHGLQSAVARPQMVAYYQGADLAEQATVLIEGLAMSHPFVDGNKRTAAVAAITFLRLNGASLSYQPSATQDEFGLHILAVVQHQETANQLADWVRQHLVPWP